MMNIEELEKIPFVFIVGRGRSGTTLLQNILDSNENMILPIESRLIIHLKNKYFRISKWSEDLIDELIVDLYKDKIFNTYWNIDKLDLVLKLKSYPIEQLTFPSICKIIYLCFPSIFPKSNIKIIGDKNPIYSVFIKDLIEIFPAAKFIHIVRDYRDNVVSNRTSFGRKSAGILAYGWLSFNQQIDDMKKRHVNSFFTLRYEDLTKNTATIVQQLCDFLKLEYTPEMLNFHEKIADIKQKKNIDALETIHKNLDKPINTEQIAKWKTNLNQQDLEVIDFICADYAKKYSYESTTKKKTVLIYLKYLSGKIRYALDFFIIKTYYKSPLFIRDFTGFTSKKLFEWFKFSTYYNHDDFRFKKTKTK